MEDLINVKEKAIQEQFVQKSQQYDEYSYFLQEAIKKIFKEALEGNIAKVKETESKFKEEQKFTLRIKDLVQKQLQQNRKILDLLEQESYLDLVKLHYEEKGNNEYIKHDFTFTETYVNN
mmetsp:Transcript_34660/g.33848  ORF Transcript_34660/g.33848 Transcript_34660/m.33848 type:complete len:120 (+) Transcript_34660:229-588(+)|eukprot:CAMPEP_0170551902 /NCGR_PEP_ID=MMETSP0211-20121228/9893_1 /TAXON_ID=311385 /ORGANISM="Pseudokeronopsis sp., Strain OXSARD2" /LENGTH=119 /DNA_ID=CAMNT_0010859357 /DNA_START=192 /DNA_END=551 /DNA_ORIENTATION=-